MGHYFLDTQCTFIPDRGTFYRMNFVVMSDGAALRATPLQRITPVSPAGMILHASEYQQLDLFLMQIARVNF